MPEKPTPEWELDLDNPELPSEADPQYAALDGVNYKVDIDYGDEEVGPDDNIKLQRTMEITGIHNADTNEDVPEGSDLYNQIARISETKFNAVNIPKSEEDLEALIAPEQEF